MGVVGRAAARHPLFSAAASQESGIRCIRGTRLSGLGANLAIFSVFDAVLLRPLPFRNADRLVEVWEDGSRIGFPMDTPAPANYTDWKLRNHVFEDMAALKGDLYALTGEGTPEQVEGSPVTANLFPLLGVTPLLGRSFSAEEDQPGGPQVVLIGYGLVAAPLRRGPSCGGTARS